MEMFQKSNSTIFFYCIFICNLICFAFMIANVDANRGNKQITDSGALESQPKFLSRGHTFRVVVGDTLNLPCEVANLGSLVLLWRRGSNVLTASHLMVTTDDRIRLIGGYNLQIKKVQQQDAGDYVCQISDKVNKDQIHTVEILVPPSLKVVHDTGKITARKGGTVTLECKAGGNPVPSIYWTKKQADLTYDQTSRIASGSVFTLTNVERSHAGTYQCTADNGVGNTVTMDLNLDVLYPPDISVEKSWIHSAEGLETNLVCIVHADPPPSVSWHQNSFPLHQTDRRVMTTRGNRHVLHIQNLQADDFGNYSCIAENTLGRAKKYMELSAKPGPIEFISQPWSRTAESFNITFKVDSYPKLEEVRLLYRKLLMNDTFQQPTKWHDRILSPVQSRTKDEPLTHIVTVELKNLLANSVYEAIAQARNRHGWNEISDMFQFYTQRSHDPRVEEMEKVASSTFRNNTQSLHKTNKSVVVLASVITTLLILFLRKFNTS